MSSDVKRLPMVWDFAEANPFRRSLAIFGEAIEWIARVYRAMSARRLHDWASRTVDAAASQTLPDDSADCVVTDPPYYDRFRTRTF